MKTYLRCRLCAAVDWLVFRAPTGLYKEDHKPEGAHCYRWLGPIHAGVLYCQVAGYQAYELSIDVWDYYISVREALGPDRECAFTGFQCFRYNLKARLPDWFRRRYRYTKNRIMRYLIPTLQYKLAKRGLASCPNCGSWDCDGDCVPF